jgi:hypothetical protein
VRSKLVLDYLDDVAMGGEAMCLLKDFLLVMVARIFIRLKLTTSRR